MSVAFRRESDEEHLEPKFERPLPPGPNLVTQRGLRLIAASIATLEDALTAPVDEVRRAEIDRDLRYWRARQASARPTLPAGEETGFGSRVRFRPAAGAETTIDIVGQDEADPANGRVAFSSPVARALNGAMAGDELILPGTFGAGEIVAVGPIPEDPQR